MTGDYIVAAAKIVGGRRPVEFTTLHGWRFAIESTSDGRTLLRQWSHLHEHWSEVGVFDTRAEARKYARLI